VRQGDYILDSKTVEQITLDFWTGQSMDVFRKDYINFIFASNV
jgi:hypothetical protein